MGTAQLRNEVENFIKKADNRFLKMVHAMALAYTAKGISLTKDELVARAMESEQAIKEGRVITIEELEKEMRNW